MHKQRINRVLFPSGEDENPEENEIESLLNDFLSDEKSKPQLIIALTQIEDNIDHFIRSQLCSQFLRCAMYELPIYFSGEHVKCLRVLCRCVEKGYELNMSLPFKQLKSFDRSFLMKQESKVNSLVNYLLGKGLSLEDIFDTITEETKRRFKCTQTWDLSQTSKLKTDTIDFLNRILAHVKEFENLCFSSESYAENNRIKSTLTEIEKWKLTIDSEMKNIEKMEFLISISGTMSCGKSTFLNVLFSKDILPHRATAMTVLPTLITIDPTAELPIQFSFDAYKLFNRILLKLRRRIGELDDSVRDQFEKEKVYKVHSTDVDNLLEFLRKNPGFQFMKEITDERLIYFHMIKIHDVVRAVFSKKEFEELLGEISETVSNFKLHDYPRIRLHASAIASTVSSNELTLQAPVTFIDTVGADDVEIHRYFRPILENVMSQCACNIYISNGSLWQNEAQSKSFEQVLRVVDATSSKFIVVINFLDLLVEKFEEQEMVNLTSPHAKPPQSQSQQQEMISPRDDDDDSDDDFDSDDDLDELEKIIKIRSRVIEDYIKYGELYHKVKLSRKQIYPLSAKQGFYSVMWSAQNYMPSPKKYKLPLFQKNADKSWLGGFYKIVYGDCTPNRLKRRIKLEERGFKRNPLKIENNPISKCNDSSQLLWKKSCMSIFIDEVLKQSLANSVPRCCFASIKKCTLPMKKIDIISLQQLKLSQSAKKTLESHLLEYSKMKQAFEVTFVKLKEYNLFMHQQFMKEMDDSYKKIKDYLKQISTFGLTFTKKQIKTFKIPCKWGKQNEKLPEFICKLLDNFVLYARKNEVLFAVLTKSSYDFDEGDKDRVESSITNCIKGILQNTLQNVHPLYREIAVDYNKVIHEKFHDMIQKLRKEYKKSYEYFDISSIEPEFDVAEESIVKSNFDWVRSSKVTPPIYFFWDFFNWFKMNTKFEIKRKDFFGHLDKVLQKFVKDYYKFVHRISSDDIFLKFTNYLIQLKEAIRITDHNILFATNKKNSGTLTLDFVSSVKQIIEKSKKLLREKSKLEESLG